MTLVSINVRDAISLRNALYHLQRRGNGTYANVRIERSGRMLTLRAPSRATHSINARTARLRSREDQAP